MNFFKDTNICSSNSPCVNGGTCIVSGNGSNYTCSCPNGYTGVNCQTCIKGFF